MNKKNTAQTLALIKGYVDSLIKTDAGRVLPVGYNPIEYIRGGLFHWVAVPFNGIEIYCELRCPNATQIEQCGDVSNIFSEKDENKKADYDELLAIRNFHEALCKLTFNKPAFDRIAEAVGNNDFVLSEKKAELERIKKQFEGNKEGMSETEKGVIETQIKTLNLQLGFILPDDTMAFICKWAMGNDVGDIKKLNKDSFLRAAALAKRHNKAPSDYLSGVYTDFNKKEIDSYASLVLDRFIEEQKIVDGAGGGGKFKWFGGASKENAALPNRPGGG